MTVSLQITRDTLTRLIRTVTTSADHATESAVSHNTAAGRAQWILGDERRWQGGQHMMRVLLTNRFEPPRWLLPYCEGVLYLGFRQQRGRAAGFVRNDDTFRVIDQIDIVGPGMPRIGLGEAGQTWDQPRNLADLNIGLIGAGRGGSVLARMLADAGVRQLCVADPDSFDLHNLGESDPMLGKSDCGKMKADAVGAELSRRCPGMSVTAVPASASAIPALHVLRQCDLLICAADHDSARLAATCIAALFLKPIIDVAAGIWRDPHRMGGSVRLVLPGHCLSCFGGLPRDAEARRTLQSAQAEQAFRESRIWSAERAGSLASLNRCAAAAAMGLIDDLLSARINHSLWMQLDFDSQGVLQVSYPHNARIESTGSCPICRQLGAAGEEGLARVPELLHGQRSGGAN